MDPVFVEPGRKLPGLVLSGRVLPGIETGAELVELKLLAFSPADGLAQSGVGKLVVVEFEDQVDSEGVELIGIRLSESDVEFEPFRSLRPVPAVDQEGDALVESKLLSAEA